MVELKPMALFGRAWQVVKGRPLPWLLGLLAALSGDLLSNIRIGPELNLIGSGDLLVANILDMDAWLRALRLLGGSLVAAAALTAIAAVVVLALVLAARAGLVAVARGGEQEAAAADLASTLRGSSHLLGSLIRLTVLVYGPFLAAAELAGVILRLVPGILRLPLYLVLLALLIVAALLPYLHTLAICAVVLDGCGPRQALAAGWRVLSDHARELLPTLSGLLLAAIVSRVLAHLILQPVAGASLLALLLTVLRGSWPNLGQVAGLLLLGSLATALLAPVYVLTTVVMALVYRQVQSSGGRAF